MTEAGHVGQVSPFLRRATNGYSHYCPGCEELHVIYDRWEFNGDVNKPTFKPSVKVTGVQGVFDKGEWTGEWKYGPDGKVLPLCCHYFLTDGQLLYQGDCTHAFVGKTIPLPELPDWARDPL